MLRTCALIPILLVTAGCFDDPASTSEATGPVDPTQLIAAPIAADLDRPPPADGCRDALPAHQWTYVWEGDRLTSAEQRDQDDTLLASHRFEWDDAGLRRWIGPEPDLVRTLERDADGRIERWTRASGDDRLVVTVDRADATVLTIEGMLYLEFETPPLIDLERLDPAWAAVAPRIDLIIEQLTRASEARGEAVWDVLGAAAMTQATRLMLDDGRRQLDLDVDGDGTPDVRETRSPLQDTSVTRIDYAVDDVIDVTLVEDADGTLRTEQDADGASTAIRTARTAAHEIVDVLDADQQIISRTSLFFDTNGQRLIKYEDRNANGRPNWRKRYVADPVTGLRAFDERDHDANGWVDTRVEYTRDPDGRVLTMTTFPIERGDCGDRW